MASFSVAIIDVIEHEKGYVNDPDDPGGATKYGISQKQFPDLNIAELTLPEAVQWYRLNYWNPYPFEKMTSQIVATRVFDIGITMGMQNMFKLLQRAIRSVTGKILQADGLPGPKTMLALEKATASEMFEFGLICALEAEIANRYRNIDKARSRPKYLKGWLNRTYD